MLPARTVAVSSLHSSRWAGQARKPLLPLCEADRYDGGMYSKVEIRAGKFAHMLTLVAVYLCLVSGCGSEAPAGRTPQLAFAAFRSAIKEKDYKTAFVQTTPESQESQLVIYTMVASMAAKRPDDQ